MAKTRVKTTDISFIQGLYSDWLDKNESAEITHDEISDYHKTATTWQDGDLIEIAGIRKN
ncbi:MAG: hypothetical protein HRT95_05650 [Moritella sp.]|uniref:hypothetical protein n=1 Tax=Moritella sp. TaxID=78556 RepID=UPI001E19AFF6|nr:hypothetical protein [Moritella sp.]NQZ49675.1 hypothetical protein [Moritella sp.]